MSLESEFRFPTAEAVRPSRPMPDLPPHWTSLASAFVFTARAQPGKRCISDSLGMQMTYGQALSRSAALARALERELSPAPNVGVLLPSCVGAALVNAALGLLGRVMVDLNTLSSDLLNQQIAEGQIEYTITTRPLLEKRELKPNGKLIFIEDLKEGARLSNILLAPWARLLGITVVKPRMHLADLLLAGLMRTLPTSLLPLMAEWFAGLAAQPDDTAAMLSTSGSTGDPKAVELSHGNILANIAQIKEHFRLQPDDCVMGALPLFHSFGFTVTLWSVLCLGLEAVYHFSPLEPEVVGALVAKNRCTIMACTPTLMPRYLEQCTANDFRSLRFLILGSESLWPEDALKIEKGLGITPIQGYGCTETSPFVAAEVLHDVTTVDGRVVSGRKPGTVGLPAAGTSIFVADPDTGAELPCGQEGVILINGPQVMKGYFKRREATLAVLRDGWYFTGDIGFVDADGMLTITDRLDRIKMSGEMVPLIGIKRAIAKAAPGSDFVVVGVRDRKKGQRPAVVYTRLSSAADEVVTVLTASGMPKLWVPRAIDFYLVAEWPIAASGKKDFKRIKELAAAFAADH